MEWDFEHLEVTVEGRVAVARLKRPERYNAIGVRLAEELNRFVEGVEGTDVRAVILTGAGDRAFCSGWISRSAAR